MTRAAVTVSGFTARDCALIQGADMNELIEYAKFPLFYLGLAAAYVDGLAIAQAWDWMFSGAHLSIWLLM